MGKKMTNKDRAWFLFLLALGSATIPGPISTEIESGSLSTGSSARAETGIEKPSNTRSKARENKRQQTETEAKAEPVEQEVPAYPLSQNKQGKLVYPNSAKEPTRPIVEAKRLQGQWVISGDSLAQAGTVTRLAGVDAPNVNECYGPEARQALSSNLEQVVYTPTGAWVKARGKNINQELVAKGFAKADSFGLDITQNQTFKQLEAKAKVKKLGVWHDC